MKKKLNFKKKLIDWCDRTNCESCWYNNGYKSKKECRVRDGWETYPSNYVGDEEFKRGMH